MDINNDNYIKLAGEGCKKVYKSIIEYTKYFNKISECKSFNIVNGNIIMRNKNCIPEYVKGKMSFTINKKKLNAKDTEQLNAMNLFLNNAKFTANIESLIAWDKINGKNTENIFISKEKGIILTSCDGQYLELSFNDIDDSVFSDINFIKEEPVDEINYDLISKGYNLHRVRIDGYFVDIYRNAIVHVKKGFEPVLKRLYIPKGYSGEEIRIISICIESKELFLENFYTIIKVNEGI